jgi:hypothetical protein
MRASVVKRRSFLPHKKHAPHLSSLTSMSRSRQIPRHTPPLTPCWIIGRGDYWGGGGGGGLAARPHPAEDHIAMTITARTLRQAVKDGLRKLSGP